MTSREILLRSAENTWDETVKLTLTESQIMVLGKLDEQFCEAVRQFRRDVQTICTQAFMREQLNRE